MDKSKEAKQAAAVVADTGAALRTAKTAEAEAEAAFQAAARAVRDGDVEGAARLRDARHDLEVARLVVEGAEERFNAAVDVAKAARIEDRRREYEAALAEADREAFFARIATTIRALSSFERFRLEEGPVLQSGPFPVEGPPRLVRIEDRPDPLLPAKAHVEAVDAFALSEKERGKYVRALHEALADQHAAVGRAQALARAAIERPPPLSKVPLAHAMALVALEGVADFDRSWSSAIAAYFGIDTAHAWHASTSQADPRALLRVSIVLGDSRDALPRLVPPTPPEPSDLFPPMGSQVAG